MLHCVHEQDDDKDDGESAQGQVGDTRGGTGRDTDTKERGDAASRPAPRVLAPLVIRGCFSTG